MGGILWWNGMLRKAVNLKQCRDRLQYICNHHQCHNQRSTILEAVSDHHGHVQRNYHYWLQRCQQWQMRFQSVCLRSVFPYLSNQHSDVQVCKCRSFLTSKSSSFCFLLLYAIESSSSLLYSHTLWFCNDLICLLFYFFILQQQQKKIVLLDPTSKQQSYYSDAQYLKKLESHIIVSWCCISCAIAVFMALAFKLWWCPWSIRLGQRLPFGISYALMDGLINQFKQSWLFSDYLSTVSVVLLGTIATQVTRPTEAAAGWKIACAGCPPGQSGQDDLVEPL